MNISANSIKVLNMFLTKYYQSEELWKKIDLKNQKNVVGRKSEKEKKEIILQMKNLLGLPMTFWFDANPKILNIKLRKMVLIHLLKIFLLKH